MHSEPRLGTQDAPAAAGKASEISQPISRILVTAQIRAKLAELAAIAQGFEAALGAARSDQEISLCQTALAVTKDALEGYRFAAQVHEFAGEIPQLLRAAFGRLA